MADDIATIGIRLDTSDLRRGENALRDIRQAGRQTEKSVDRLSDSFRQATSRAGGYSERMSATTSRQRNFGIAAQNVSFQVQDLATQVSSGTNAFQALGQQLPQLLGGFGAVGAAIGAVVAVLGGLAQAYFTSSEETDKANDKTKSYSDSLEATNEIIKELNKESKTRAQRLREEGNAALEGARKEVQAAQAKLEAFREGQAVTGLGGFLQEQLGLGDRPEDLDPRARRGLESAENRLQDRASEAAERLENLEQRLADARGAVRQKRIDEVVQDIAREADENMRLADALEQSVEKREMVAQRIEAENLAREENIKVGSKEFDQILKLVRARDDEIDRLEKLQDLRSAAQNIRDEFQTPQQEFDARKRQLDQLRDKDLISGDIYSRALEKANEELEEATGLTARYGKEIQALEQIGDQAFNRIGEAITKMSLEGQDAMKSLQNIGNAVISELMQAFIRLSIINPLKNALLGGNNATLSGVGGLIGELIGGAATGGAGGVTTGSGATLAIPSGGGRASGGPVTAGESYIVGEKQPELFVPRQNGTILPSVPQGGGTTEVNVYSSGGEEPEIRRSRNGNGGERIDVILDRKMKESVASGRIDKEMRARYGITPSTGTR